MMGHPNPNKAKEDEARASFQIRRPARACQRCLSLALFRGGAATSDLRSGFWDRPGLLREWGLAVEPRRGTKLFFDPQKLIVLCDAVGAAGRAGLDLPSRGSHGEIGDKSIFGFAGAVGDDGVVARSARQLDRLNRFGDASDLIQLDKNRVRDSLLDPSRQPLRIRHEKIVAHQLNFLLRGFVADALCQRFPAGPIVFRHAVFNRDNRILFCPRRPVRGHFAARAGGLVGLLEDVLAASLVAPTGMTINSWKPTELWACAPPFKMFIIGQGSRFADLSVE